MDADDFTRPSGHGETTLSLEYREIDEIDSQEIPQLRECSRLSIAHNRFKTFRSIEVSCPYLAYLVADFNQVTSLAEIQRLAALPRLVSLSLIGNPLTQVDGYRSLVAVLLPTLQVLDGSPLTAEDKTAAATYCRRNLGRLSALIDNKTSISLFQSMANALKAQMEAAYQSEASLRSLPRTDYKTLWRAANAGLQTNLRELQHIWAIELIEDLELIAADMQANVEGIDYIMDRAVLQLSQLQLGRIEELKDKVNGMISERNNIVELLAKDPALVRESIAKRQAAIGISGMTPSRTNTAIESPQSAVFNKQTGHKTDSAVKISGTKLLGESSGQNRIDSLVNECQTLDSEISAVVGYNLSREAAGRLLDDRSADLRAKVADMKRLEEIRDRLRQDLAAISMSSSLVERSIEEGQRLEAEIELLKEEISDIKSEIKGCLEEETFRESADELRHYHLKVKFFAGIRDFLRAKRKEAVVDDFREFHLQRKLFDNLTQSCDTEKRLKIVADKLKITLLKEWNADTVEDQLAEKFQEIRAVQWRGFFFRVLEEYKDHRQQKESLKSIANKFYRKNLVAKSFASLKREHLLLASNPVLDDQHYRLTAKPIVDQKRLQKAWTSWKNIFKSELKPLYLKRRQLETLLASKRKASVLRALRDYTASTKIAHLKIAERRSDSMIRSTMAQWQLSTKESVARNSWISRRMAYGRLRRAFKGFLGSIRVQQREALVHAIENRRSEATLQSASSVLETPNPKITTSTKKEESIVERFRQKWNKRATMADPQNSEVSQKIVKQPKSDATTDDFQTREDAILMALRDAELESRLQQGLPSLVHRSKAGRKRLLLALWREASVKSRQIRMKTEIIQNFVKTNMLRRVMRGLKKERLAAILSTIRQNEKASMLQQERSRLDTKHMAMTQHESESITDEISRLTIMLKERQLELEASAVSNKKLQESIDSLQTAADLVNEETSQTINQSEKQESSLQESLNERRFKTAALERELKEALAEVTALDQRIEGTRP